MEEERAGGKTAEEEKRQVEDWVLQQDGAKEDPSLADETMEIDDPSRQPLP